MNQHASQIDKMSSAEAHIAARQRPDGGTNPAGEVGWYLTQERLRRGIGLEAASNQTGIHPSHIFAIEHGDMTRMPPRVEALEMIAAYANFLGFDPEPLLQHYVTFLPAPQLAPKRHPADPAPLTSAKVLKFGKYIPKIPPLNIKNFKLPPAGQFPGGQNGLIASLAGAFILLASAAWFLSPPGEVRESIEFADAEVSVPQATAVDEPATDNQQAISDQAAPDAMAGTDPMPTATTGTDAADITVSETSMINQATASLPAPADLPSTTPAVTEQEDLGAFIQKTLAQETGTSASTTASTAAIAPPVAPETAPLPAAADAPLQTASTSPVSTEGQVFGSQDPNARLVIKATADVWVRIEDSAGQVVMTQGLKKGDVYRVPEQPGLTIIAKDGGLLTYFIDGQDKGLLGKPGEILANEALDTARLLSRG